MGDKKSPVPTLLQTRIRRVKMKALISAFFFCIIAFIAICAVYVYQGFYKVLQSLQDTGSAIDPVTHFISQNLFWLFPVFVASITLAIFRRVFRWTYLWNYKREHGQYPRQEDIPPEGDRSPYIHLRLCCGTHRHVYSVPLSRRFLSK